MHTIMLKYFEDISWLYDILEVVTYQKHKETFNKKSELLCKCRHANKFFLNNYTEITLDNYQLSNR